MELRITPVDDKKEQQGEWATYRGVKLLIARSNNINFRNAFKRLTRPYRQELDSGTLDDETSADIVAESLAEGVLLDWKNFPGDIEYSKENAKKLLLNDSDCLDFVRDFSDDLNNYLIRDAEAIAGK